MTPWGPLAGWEWLLALSDYFCLRFLIAPARDAPHSPAPHGPASLSGPPAGGWQWALQGHLHHSHGQMLLIQGCSFGFALSLGSPALAPGERGEASRSRGRGAGEGASEGPEPAGGGCAGRRFFYHRDGVAYGFHQVLKGIPSPEGGGSALPAPLPPADQPRARLPGRAAGRAGGRAGILGGRFPSLGRGLCRVLCLALPAPPWNFPWTLRTEL